MIVGRELRRRDIRLQQLVATGPSDETFELRQEEGGEAQEATDEHTILKS